MFNISYSCNMSCRGCVTLSDIPRDGVEDFDNLVQSFEDWSRVIDPNWVMIFGGETLLHPRIKDILLEVRRCYPNSKIAIATNALLLRRICDADWIKQVLPLEVRVSLHKDDSDGRFFKPLLSDLMGMFSDWQYALGTEDAQNPPSKSIPYKYAFINPNGLTVAVSQNEDFVVPYDRDSHGNIIPYNSDPDLAFAHCVCPDQLYIYKNLLYKCLPYPNLQDTQPNFQRRWPMYKPYRSTDDLTEFFANRYKSHAICTMCPESGSIKHSDPQNVRILPKAAWIQKQIKLNT